MQDLIFHDIRICCIDTKNYSFLIDDDDDENKKSKR